MPSKEIVVSVTIQYSDNQCKNVFLDEKGRRNTRYCNFIDAYNRVGTQCLLFDKKLKNYCDRCDECINMTASSENKKGNNE